MQLYDVEISSIKSNTEMQLSDTFYRNCNFCSKTVKVNPLNFKSCIKLSGSNFYCPFCLRNNFHHKLSKNILIMSFRSIIAAYYKILYVDLRKIWYTDISKMIENHMESGLQNPVLNYDPSTFLWFVDFNRIGDVSKKAPVSEINKVTSEILKSFMLDENFGAYSYEATEEKFNKAIMLFYSQRKRPKNKRMLIPTLMEIHTKNDAFWESTRNFTSSDFILL